MKRARKGGFFADIFKNKQNDSDDLNTYSKKPVDIDIDENDKRDYQLKYYGKIIDEKLNENFSNSNEISKEEVILDTSENQKNAITEEDSLDDDMKIIRKNGNEKIEVIGRENDIVSHDDSKSNTKHEKKTHFVSKNKKLAGIFAISLVVIIFTSILTFCLSDFFGLQLLFNDDSISMSQDYMKPVDEVTGKVNVLILGVDKEGLRTDTIIIASFDTDDSTVNILSIPRDTRMYVGSKYQKINAAHAITNKGKIKGPQGTVDAVTRLTGIPINYYVEFSFDAFSETIDALGGIYYNVPQNMKYSDPVQDLYINLKQGYQLLDGDKAQQLVRFRQYPEGDIKRVRVQQDFIKCVAEQKLNASIITKLPDLYKALSKNIKTNFKISDMTKYAPSLLKLDSQSIFMHELPGEYSGSEYSASYWIADMDKVAMLVSDTFGYDNVVITTGKPGTNYKDDKGSDKSSDKTSDKSSDKTSDKTSDNSTKSTASSNSTSTQNQSQKSTANSSKNDKEDKKDDKDNKQTLTPKPSQSSSSENQSSTSNDTQNSSTTTSESSTSESKENTHNPTSNIPNLRPIVTPEETPAPTPSVVPEPIQKPSGRPIIPTN